MLKNGEYECRLRSERNVFEIITTENIYFDKSVRLPNPPAIYFLNYVSNSI